MEIALEVPGCVEIKVKNTLHKQVYNDLLQYIELTNPRFCGTVRQEDFVEQNLLLALYHDITGKGYQSILAEVELQGAINHKSFQHNTQEICRLGDKWAQQYIDLPLLEERLVNVHQS
jgi:hypothetical protein